MIVDDPEWTATRYEELQARIKRQRIRETRVPVPTWDEVVRNLPPGFRPADIPKKFVLNLVCFGYQPELASAWSTSTWALRTDATADPVFDASLLWVTTKAIRCSYCMGHAEMNWMTAGLTPPEISERSRLLAGADWSSFPGEQQRAFSLAQALQHALDGVGGGNPEPQTRLRRRPDDGDHLVDLPQQLLDAYRQWPATPPRTGRRGLQSQTSHLTVTTRGTRILGSATHWRTPLEYRSWNQHVWHPQPRAAPSDRGSPRACLLMAAGGAVSAVEISCRVALLDDAEAWKALPPIERGTPGRLPIWARAMARGLPATTAAMLELDGLHRAGNPVERFSRARFAGSYPMPIDVGRDANRPSRIYAEQERMQMRSGPCPGIGRGSRRSSARHWRSHAI